MTYYPLRLPFSGYFVIITHGVSLVKRTRRSQKRGDCYELSQEAAHYNWLDKENEKLEGLIFQIASVLTDKEGDDWYEAVGKFLADPAVREIIERRKNENKP